MNFGWFDDENKEYVITDPRTPVKWINYIGSLSFGGFVDQTGGGVLCKGDPALNRITRYNDQSPASDFRAQTVYIRLHSETGYKIFSPFYVPTLDPFDGYECRVGLGYTRFVTEFYGIQTEITVFIPQGGSCELRLIRVTNHRPEAVDLDIVPVVEYTHPDSLKQLTNADWVPQTMQSKLIDEDGKPKILIQSPFMNRDTQINYFTTSLPASSFETDRQQFLGMNGYGTWKNPLALQNKELGCHETLRGDNIGALLVPLGALQPGEARVFVVQCGQGTDIKAVLPEIQGYREVQAVETAFRELVDWWQSTLSVVKVNTPDSDFNRMVNIHNPRQCVTTLNWSRYLSLYQLGYGSRGIGFRDSSQDVMAVFASLPEQGRDLLCNLLRVQKRDGSAMHQFNPLSMIASEGDSLERDDRPHYYSDDHLWGVWAVTTYLKETGDMGFLERLLPFYDQDREGRPIETGSVLDHMQRALAFTRVNKGSHGLPLLGFADWNDTVNLEEGAESLFSAHLYGRVLLEMIELMQLLGNTTGAEAYETEYRQMQDCVENAAWDGSWYIRYFDANGKPIGSHTNERGQIYVNGQSWAVISGFASPDHARQAMQSVYERLNTRYGIKLSAPGYDGFDPHVGGITTYPPGAKENGGIFLHANPWAMIAETMLGNGDRAYQYYCQINPALRNEDIERYEVEPYVYCQNILGDEHPQFGLGRNSWLSGTSSWTYQAATKYILGIQPGYNGLTLHPCIPALWKGFRVIRKFRGAEYHIEVHNPHHLSLGTIRMSVNGTATAGNLIPLQPAGSICTIEAWLE